MIAKRARSISSQQYCFHSLGKFILASTLTRNFRVLSMLKGEGVCGSLDNSIIPKLKHTLLKHKLRSTNMARIKSTSGKGNRTGKTQNNLPNPASIPDVSAAPVTEASSAEVKPEVPAA